MPRVSPLPWLLLGFAALAPSCTHASSPSRGHDAPGVTMTASPANRFVKAYAEADVTALVRVEAQQVEHGERPPANLALVVDTSGSMEGRPIEDARAAALALVGQLGPKDHLAVVVFHARTEVLLPSTALDDADLPELRAAIGRMRAQGTTDMAGGLRAGLAEVEKSYDPRGVNRIILLGDGVPNDAAPVEPMLAEAAQHRVAVTALGLGADYNESLMGHIALATGGRFHYVADSSKVATFFHEEITRVHDAYARNARLVLTPGPGVSIEAVVGQDTVRNGATVEVLLGDLSYGDLRDIVVKAHAAPHRDGAPVEVLDAALTFTEGTSGDAVDRSAFLGVRATADDEQVAKGHDAEVEKEAARMEEAAKTVETIRDLRRGDDRARPAAPAEPSPTAAMEAPRPAPMTQPPEDLKAEHDRAMGILQGH